MDTPIIRLLLADVRPCLHNDLRALLSQTSDLLVVAEAECGLQVVRIACEQKPDVVMIDEQYPDICCVEITKQLRSAGYWLGILLLTSSEDSLYRKPVIQAGANGFIPKSAENAELIEAIHAVCEASRIAVQFHHAV